MSGSNGSRQRLQPGYDEWPDVGDTWPSARRTDKRQQIPHHIRVGVYQRDGRVCEYCGRIDGDMHLDHVVPWSAGGSDSSRNLRVLCAECNLARGVTVDWTDTRTRLPVVSDCLNCLPPEWIAGWIEDGHLFQTLSYCLNCGHHDYSNEAFVDGCPDRMDNHERQQR